MAAGSKKIIFAALIGNGLIAVTKFAAAVLTGSSAMLSEGIHSVVDTGNQGLLLYGLARAKRPPDPEFPFGHGKEIYFWTFVVSILIFAVGAGVSIYEGIHSVLHPEPVQNATVNYIVLGLALIFEGVAWYMAFREFNLNRGQRAFLAAVHGAKDPTTFAVLFEDTAAMLGLLVAGVGIYLSQVTGILWLDGAAAIAIGLILAGTAAWLAFETKSLLIGEAAEPEIVAGIRSLVSERSNVEEVNEVLTLHMGPEFILVNVSVDFLDAISAEQLEATIDELDGAIKAQFPLVKRVFVEAEKPGTEVYTPPAPEGAT